MPRTSKRASVLLIDPSPVHRRGIRRLLETSSFTITEEVAAASDVAASTRRKSRPDLILLSHHGSAGQLSDAIARLREARGAARVVVLVSDLTLRQLTDALRAGVDGFLSSDISGTALVQSLELVLTGERVLPGDLARMLITEYGDGAAGAANGTGLDTLSSRELDILKCLINGLSNKLIANKLDVNEATVKAHVKIILRKTGTKNRTQAAIWAVNHSLERRAADSGRAPDRRSTSSRLLVRRNPPSPPRNELD